MDEDQSSRESSQGPKPSQEVQQPHQRVPSSALQSSADNSQNRPEPHTHDVALGEAAALALEPNGGQSEATDEQHNDVVTADILAVDPQSAQTAADQDTTVDTPDVNGDTPMELDSRPLSPLSPLSPNPADSTAAQSPMHEDFVNSPQSSTQLSNGISHVAQSPRESHDAKAQGAREVIVVSPASQDTSTDHTVAGRGRSAH